MDIESIGKYRIVGLIGQGAMGEVYKALDPVLNRHVALKMMSASMAADPDLVQRFHREAQSAARLNHPNIVTVFDFGDAQGKFYMAMELLQGTDLKDVIASGAFPSLWDKLSLMEQICDGLAFAHANGVVHRDLKPANIQVQANGRVKIMDFGLARLQASDMTKTGMVMGTPNYMSPEQVRGQKADARSDIFSLGAVFYELLCGKKAFNADSMHTILFKVLDEEPEPMRTFAPDLPIGLSDLIDRALQKDPDERLQDAASVKAALAAVRDTLTDAPDGDVEIGRRSGDTLDDTTQPTVMELGSRPGSSIKGATALDLSRSPRPATAVRQPATLSGRAPTERVPSQPRPEPPSPRSRAPLVVMGVAALAAAGGAVWYMSSRSATAPHVTTLAPADMASEQVGILTEALVRSQVELARLDLDNKDYKGAIAQAQKTLAIDPKSDEARDVLKRAQGVLADLESAASEARTAFQAGDAERASRALGRVMAIDPRHPVAMQLSAALNEHFRSQAEEARRASTDSRTAADRIKSAAFEGYAQAAAIAKEGEALLSREQFAVATQKFLESRDGFERSRRAAELAARTASAPHVVTGGAATAGGTTPVPTAGQHVVPGPTPPPATVAAATPPPVTAPAPPTMNPTEAAVRRVIADYGHAIEAKDLALFKTVKPNLSGDEAKRLAEAFKAIKSQQVGITIDSVQIDGATATVRISRQDTINGKAMRGLQQTFKLAQQGGVWTIVSIGQ
jgi:serine/threonine protein kinase/tetratricopeptide (TPR) repeat protein